MDLYRELNLEPVRSEPDVWVNRIMILERITPAPVVIRDIPLSRGLNIVPHPVFWTQVFFKPPWRLSAGRAIASWPARG
jgi:hypothetical protein